MKKSRLFFVFCATLITISLAIYLLVVGYFYTNQDRLLFQNQKIAQIPDIDKLQIRDIRIKTEDNEVIQAWYEPAKNGRPTILFFHGNGSILEYAKWRYLRMHKQGVGFLAIAYRGYSQSSGSPSEGGLLLDGIAGYNWLIENKIAPMDIVIHGHSLGSGVASYVASKKPARALLLEAPFTSAADAAKSHYPFLPVDLLMKNRFESKIWIKNARMPVLIAHGTLDQVIPYSQGIELYEAVNAPKKFIRMENSDHNTLTRDGVYDYYWNFIGLKPMDFAPEIKIGNQ